MTQSLEQLLRTMKTMPEATPSDSFRKNARIRILNTIVVPPHHSWFFHAGRVFGGFTAASFLVGGSVVFAAQHSAPGSFLYPVKTASERVVLRLAPTGRLKNDVATSVIDRRIREIESVKTHGTKEEIDTAEKNYTDTVSELEHMAGVSADQVKKHAQKHSDRTETESRQENTESDHKEHTDQPADRRIPSVILRPMQTDEDIPMSSSVTGIYPTTSGNIGDTGYGR